MGSLQRRTGMSDSPFVGPRPFEKEDSDKFFGRTRETEELLSLIIAHRAVFVYAQSGAGKSSLLRAGVIPRLLERGYKVLPPARVYASIQPIFLRKRSQTSSSFMRCSTGRRTCANGQSAEKSAQMTLSEFLKPLVPASRAGEESAAPLMVIVLDQFEEFFTANAVPLAGATLRSSSNFRRRLRRCPRSRSSS